MFQIILNVLQIVLQSINIIANQKQSCYHHTVSQTHHFVVTKHCAISAATGKNPKVVLNAACLLNYFYNVLERLLDVIFEKALKKIFFCLIRVEQNCYNLHSLIIL